MKICIRGARIFTPQGRVEGDLLVEEGRIAEIGEVTSRAEREIDGRGCFLWPGAIDGHVHFREPGLIWKEDWTSGSQAAVAGGVTTVFDMPNTSPPTTTLERLEEKRALARAKSLCNFGLFFGAGLDNLEEIKEVRGVPGLKIFMADSTGELLVDKEEDLRRIFQAYGGQICVHAESQKRMDERRKKFAHIEDPAIHSKIRDSETAAQALALAASLAVEFERSLHILHVSSRAELHALRAAREEIQGTGNRARITAEVCPHHLFMDVDAYTMWGTRVQMNPPLRSAEDREAMWDGLNRGELEMIATDHAPHLPVEKAQPYGEAPSGVPGVETMLPLMLDAAFRGLCTYEEVLQWVAYGPAQIYGLVDRGQIVVGHHADLVLIDPRMMRTVKDKEQRSRCGWTPWAGRDLVGWPIWTMVNGKEVFRREGKGPGAILVDEAVGDEVKFRR